MLEVILWEILLRFVLMFIWGSVLAFLLRKLAKMPALRAQTVGIVLAAVSGGLIMSVTYATGALTQILFNLIGGALVWLVLYLTRRKPAPQS